MSRIRGESPSQWVLATQPRIPESLMIDDEDEDHAPHKDIPESQDDEFARSVRVRDAARGALSPWTQIRGFAELQSLLLVLIG